MKALPNRTPDNGLNGEAPGICGMTKWVCAAWGKILNFLAQKPCNKAEIIATEECR
jgi:hypothetical protein